MIQDIEEESKTKFSMDVEFSFSFKGSDFGENLPLPGKVLFVIVLKGQRAQPLSGAILI